MDSELHEQLIRAYEDSPEHVHSLVAARVALRILPLGMPAGSLKDPHGRSFALGYFRCAGLAYAAGLPIDTGRFRHLAGRAADQFDDLTHGVSAAVVEAGGCAYFAARIAENTSLSDFESILDYSDRALVRRRVSAPQRRRFLEIILRDFQRARAGAEVMSVPIWPTRAPTWADNSWLRAKVALHGLHEVWEIWTDWYDARLAGASILTDEEYIRFSVADEFEVADPEVVNARVSEALGRAPEADSGEPQPIPGPYAVKWHEGRLEARPTLGVPSSPPVAEDMLDSIRELAEKIRESLVDNLADHNLRKCIDNVILDLSHPVGEIRIGRLQIDLRVVQGFSDAYADSSREYDLTLRGMLTGLASSLLDFTAQYPAIREMEAGRIALHVVTQENVEPILTPLAEIREIARNSPVVGKSVVEALDEGDLEVVALTNRISDARISPAAKVRAISDRSNIIGQKLLTVWNVGAEALRWSKAIAARTGHAAIDGLEDGVRAGVETTVSGAITTGAAALAMHLGDPMLAISLVVHSFRPLAKKAREEGGPAEDT